MKRNIRFLSLLFLCAATLSMTRVAGQSVQIDVRVKSSGIPIQKDMYGIFFEDINFGADGGLYAEMVKNRSFEFPEALMGWKTFGDVSVQASSAPFGRNPHYVRINSTGSFTRAGMQNEGFARGMGIRQGEMYDVSFYARTQQGKPLKLAFEIVGSDNNAGKASTVEVSGADWKKYTLSLESDKTDAHALLRFFVEGAGVIDMEHLSMFPRKTWKGRDNGMREDLAQALADLKPGVFRFPGGCIVEGTDLATRYQWKNSVGPVEDRPLNINRWNYTFKHRFFPDYFQSYGLGFYEFFLLCEDFGAQALPVLSCGLSCQYENKDPQQNVPVDALAPYIQDALDLIEFANGPADSRWGKVRADMGHPTPFGLKYIAIGNENWDTLYTERLEAFIAPIRKAYPDIRIIGSSGPLPEGKDFEFLWPQMKRLGVDLVDEHFYRSPEWFYAQAARYDSYDRKGPKVFAGEYASHTKPVKKNSWEAALSEAAFMTGLERNADVVHLATYAPLFAHYDAWQWNPDLIWFDNLDVVRSANYYVQQLYAVNRGTNVLTTTLGGKPVSGQQNLYATAALDRDNAGDIIIKIANSSPESQQVRLVLEGLKNKGELTAEVVTLGSGDLGLENTREDKNAIVPRSEELKALGNVLNLTLEGQSFSVVRVKR